MRPGDLVKIVLQGPYNGPEDIVVGTIIEASAIASSLSPDSSQSSSPIYKIKILKIDGEIWDSWIDQRDSIEIL